MTDVYLFDLFSHDGQQITTHPLHHFIVHDEIGFSNCDVSSKLTDDASYIFSRSTETVNFLCGSSVQAWVSVTNMNRR